MASNIHPSLSDFKTEQGSTPQNCRSTPSSTLSTQPASISETTQKLGSTSSPIRWTRHTEKVDSTARWFSKKTKTFLHLQYTLTTMCLLVWLLELTKVFPNSTYMFLLEPSNSGRDFFGAVGQKGSGINSTLEAVINNNILYVETSSVCDCNIEKVGIFLAT